jgi:lipid-A-disaccharide synthase
MHRQLKIAMIAGETSGDQLGGWLMAALRNKQDHITFVGLGGPMMQAQGLTSIFPIREIALIGIAEILPHVFNIRRRIRQTVAMIEYEKPDLLITIDVPGFALRVLKMLHARGNVRPKLVHYVAPTVWAYRPKRAKIVAERYDYLLCLLPFEPPYFTAENLPTSYIGHEVAWWWKQRGDAALFIQHHRLIATAPILAVFPGSRTGEINRLWPVFRAAIEQLKTSIPTLQVVIQVPPVLLPRMQLETLNWSIKPLVIDNQTEKKDLFAASTAALAKSGTIGLECALAGLPSIVAYKANRLSAFLLRHMIKVPYVNLANILAEKMVVPELLQEHCTPEKLVAAMLPLLTDASARSAQREQLNKIAAMLGADDTHSPSEKAADILLGLLEKNN